MALIDDIKDCQLCRDTLPMDPKPIVQFNPEAPILIAGQAPGIRAHKHGRPFCDPSGDRLRQWLGVTSEQFYNSKYFAILPMGFCYPGTGKSGDLPPMPLCAQTWRADIITQLKDRKLTLVLGQYAMNYHSKRGYKTVTEAVEDWRSSWPEQLILPHPSPRNNRWFKRNPWFELDVIPQLQARVRQLLWSVDL
ncbi:uracil-DNA glycosylase family protein [Pseudoalteromonas sp. SSDWG2]|uniref:uracil-DNA glycosylase family protein n=1 Tax=Pseudoalteromonas sp. SSDWG2 TaxID=3139391 RepID=UPI003BA90BD5